MSTEKRYLICAAFSKAAELFHSGQNSLGYKKLCQAKRCGYREGPLGSCWKEKDSPERNELAALYWKHRYRIRHYW